MWKFEGLKIQNLQHFQMKNVLWDSDEGYEASEVNFSTACWPNLPDSKIVRSFSMCNLQVVPYWVLELQSHVKYSRSRHTTVSFYFCCKNKQWKKLVIKSSVTLVQSFLGMLITCLMASDFLLVL